MSEVVELLVLLALLAMPACVTAAIIIGLASRPALALVLVAAGVLLLSALLLGTLADDPEPGESFGEGLGDSPSWPSPACS